METEPQIPEDPIFVQPRTPTPPPDPTPSPSAPASPSSSPTPAPSKGGNMMKYIGFGIIAIILGVGIGLGAHSLANKTAANTIISSTISQSGHLASTTVASSGNATCPCLSEQQAGQILNDSTTESAGANFNIIYAPDSTAVASLPGELNGSSQLLSNVTRGWELQYNNTINATAKELLTELVFETRGSASAALNQSLQLMQTMNSGNSLPSGEVNGYKYYYINATFFGSTVMSVVGTKGSYIVTIAAMTPNKGPMQPNAIASLAGSAIPSA